jgi:hypothetical protein
LPRGRAKVVHQAERHPSGQDATFTARQEPMVGPVADVSKKNPTTLSPFNSVGDKKAPSKKTTVTMLPN